MAGDGRRTNNERDAWLLETSRNAYAPAADGGGRTRLTEQDLPVYEGVIHVGLGAQPVPYRIIAVCEGMLEGHEFHALAVSTCRIACLTADVIRGKLPSSSLRRAVAAPCIKRIETLVYLIGVQMKRDIELNARMRYLPVVPHDVSGTLVSETSLEMAVRLTIGGTVYWSTIRLERFGCRWVCVVADMG